MRRPAQAWRSWPRGPSRKPNPQPPRERPCQQKPGEPSVRVTRELPCSEGAKESPHHASPLPPEEDEKGRGRAEVQHHEERQKVGLSWSTCQPNRVGRI